jgi:hypothetical protein
MRKGAHPSTQRARSIGRPSFGRTFRLIIGKPIDRFRRILVVAGRPGEGPFTIRFADLRRGVARTATYAWRAA